MTMKFIKQLLSQSEMYDKSDSSVRADQAEVETFVTNPENPFLVSFPRTGSHWLRMLMELYFERPSLVRTFYYAERRNYLMLHTHDIELDVARTHVIYLYRDPVDTIYSQLNYHQEKPDDVERIAHWSDLYGRHLDKWLHREAFTVKKTVLTYEEMQRDLAAGFAKVTSFFGETVDPARLENASKRVTKGEVKRKTAHDSQVMQLGQGYAMSRQTFREQHGAQVWEALRRDRAHLAQDFENSVSR